MFNIRRTNNGHSNKSNRRRATQLESRQTYDRLEPKLPLTTFVVDTILDSPGGPDDGLVSLREAVTAANTNAEFGDAVAGDANGDRIVFADELANTLITLTQGELSLTDDVLIQAGDLNVTIDATATSRHFSVTTSERVGFGGLTLINGLADQGGSISSTGGGSVLIVGSTLESNSANGDGGGAVFSASGAVYVSGNSTFTGNHATGSSGSGGAILTESGVVAVTGGKMLSNRANRSGGAVEIIDGQFYAADLIVGELGAGNVAGPEGAANPGNGGGLHVAGSSRVVISGGSVAYNAAAGSGGGLWNSVDSDVFLRAGAVISNNIASGDGPDEGGGGVYNDGGDVFIRDAIFSDNSASGNSGGGIFSTGGRVIAIGSTVGRNRSAGNGGGLEISGGLLSLDNTTIDTNTAGVSLTANDVGNGGGLNVTGESTRTILHDTIIRGNAAPLEGGGIWNQAGNGMFLSGTTTISGNSSFGNGGGVYNAAYVRSVATTFEGNESGAQGGGLFNAEPGGARVQNAIFRENSADTSGGGLSSIRGFLNLIESTFVDNTSSYNRFDDVYTGPAFLEENNVFLPPTDTETPIEPDLSDRVFSGAIADIPVADDGATDFYYDAETGSVLVSVGADVLSIELRGNPFDLVELNRSTELGEPQLEGDDSIGFSDVTGLPVGVHDLGQILPADGRVSDGSRFEIRFGQLVGKTFAVGKLENQSAFLILPTADGGTSGGVFGGSLADVPAAADRTANFYYDTVSGSVLVSIGPEVLVLALEGYPFDYEQLNRFSDLGEPLQEDDAGLGFLNFSGLPVGVFDLGPILPANVFIETTSQFNNQFPDLAARSGAAGEPERRPDFIVIPWTADGIPVIPEAPSIPETPEAPTTPETPSTPATPTGIFAGSLADFDVPAERTADFYYDAVTGSVLVAIGPEVLVIGLQGYSFDYDQLNRATGLGEPEQADEVGLGFLDFTGLPIGVYDLGPILPADVLIETVGHFNDRFDQLLARSGSPGDPEKQPAFIILPANGPDTV